MVTKLDTQFNIKPLLVSAIALGFFLLVFPMPILTMHKYIIVCLILILSIISNSKNYKTIGNAGYFYGAFLIWGLLSFFWATVGSLIWFPLFIFVILFLWSTLVHAVIRPTIRFSFAEQGLLFLSAILSIYILLLHTWALLAPAQLNVSSWLGGNSNYTLTLTGFALVPLLLWNNKFVQGSGLMGCTYLLLISNWYNSTGSTIVAFLLIVGFAIWCWKKYIKLIGALTVAIVSLIWLTPLFGQSNSVSLPIIEASHQNRGSAIYASILLFKDHFFNGVGLGNWIVEIFPYYKDGALVDTLSLQRVDNHNSFSKLISEMGIIGAFLYSGFWTLIFLKVWTQRKKLVYIEKCAMVFIILYLLSSCYYYTARCTDEFFSGYELLAYSAAGLFISRDKPYLRAPIGVMQSFIIITTLLSGIWITYYYVQNEKIKTISSIENPNTAIALSESVKHEIFTTTHGRRSWAGYPLSLDYKMAILAENVSPSLSNTYYQSCLANHPYDDVIKMEYARFLIEHNRNTEGADSILNNIRNRQPLFMEAKILHIESLIKKEDWIGVIKILKETNVYKVYPFVIDYYSLLYFTSSDCIDYLNLSEDQINEWTSINNDFVPIFGELRTAYFQLFKLRNTWLLNPSNNVVKTKYVKLNKTFRKVFLDLKLERNHINILDLQQSLRYLSVSQHGRISDILIPKLLTRLKTTKSQIDSSTIELISLIEMESIYFKSKLKSKITLRDKASKSIIELERKNVILKRKKQLSKRFDDHDLNIIIEEYN